MGGRFADSVCEERRFERIDIGNGSEDRRKDEKTGVRRSDEKRMESLEKN